MAVGYIRNHGDERPYCLFLSWGPPHNPYQDVPQRYRDMYDPEVIAVRPNVPEADREALAGYYADVTALDDAIGRIVEALEERGQAEDTILVFTSDHGDMLGSHGVWRKQWPWDESTLVPMILRYPAIQSGPQVITTPINTPDLMPTLLNLAGAPIPSCVEGTDLAFEVLGENGIAPASALIGSVAPFGECPHAPEWRGVRTDHYTYVRTLRGPWLLYDNQADPCQMNNLVDDPAHAGLRRELDAELERWLAHTHDPFLPAQAHREMWGYEVDELNQIPYTWFD